MNNGDLNFNYLNDLDNKYNNTSDSLLKASINNALAFGKMSKNSEVKARATELAKKIGNLHQSEYYSQDLFNELYQALGSDDRARGQLELASEVSGVTNEEFNSSLNAPHIKLQDKGVDEGWTPVTSKLNGELYYRNDQTGELLTSKEFNTVDYKDKNLVSIAGFNEDDHTGFDRQSSSIMQRLQAQASEYGTIASPVGTSSITIPSNDN